MPRIEVEPGAELYYTDAGTGRPVVLVHGGFMSHRLWDPQITALADQARVLAIDLRGHGRSDRPYEGHSAARYADDIAVFLEELDLTDAVYVGWSLGATTGAYYLGRHDYNDRLGRAVFTSTGIFHGLAEQVTDGSGDDGLDFDALVRAHRTRNPEAMREFVDGIFTAEVGEATRRWVWEIAMGTPHHVVLDVLDIYASMDYARLETSLRDVDVPVDAWQGAHDAAATPEEARIVADEVLPDGRFVGFPDSGHVPFLEEQERFAAELRSVVES